MNKIAQKTRLCLGVLLGLALAACSSVPSDSPFKNGDIYGYSVAPGDNVRMISTGELHFAE